jgi:hypothetical protein
MAGIGKQQQKRIEIFQLENLADLKARVRGRGKGFLWRKSRSLRPIPQEAVRERLPILRPKKRRLGSRHSKYRSTPGPSAL